MTTTQQFIDQSQQSQLNVLHHVLTVELDSHRMIESAVVAWGRTLQNTKAAPSWKTLDAIITDFQQDPLSVSIVTNELGAGVIDFSLTAHQQTKITDIKNILITSAQKYGASSSSIDSASEAFDRQLNTYFFVQAFNSSDCKTVMSDFLKNMAAFNVSFIHPRHGQLNDTQMLSLSSIRAEPSQQQNSDDFFAAVKPNAEALSTIKEYRSLGEMVKANDAAALKKTIQDGIANNSSWLKDNEDTLTRLFEASVKLAQGSDQSYLKIFQVLIEDAHMNLDAVHPDDPDSMTPLYRFTMTNKVDLVDYFISKGASLNTGSDHRNLLMVAASYNADLVVNSLVKNHDFLVNDISMEGRTALHYAALGENDCTAPLAVKALMNLGADPTITDRICMDGPALPENYIDEDNDELYAQLQAYRSKWEAGDQTPLTTTENVISKARSLLGF